MDKLHFISLLCFYIRTAQQIHEIGLVPEIHTLRRRLPHYAKEEGSVEYQRQHDARCAARANFGLSPLKGELVDTEASVTVVFETG